MNQPPIARIVACSAALCAFAVAIVVGLAVDNPTPTILLRAVGSLIVCYVVGSIVGAVAERAARDAAAAHRQANPAPPVEEVRAGAKALSPTIAASTAA